MRFDPELAEIRFGYGLAPALPRPASPEAMLAGLTGPDTMRARFEIEDFDTFLERTEAVQALWKQRRKSRGTPEGDALRKQINLMKKDARQAKLRWLGQTLLRRAHTETAFRERVVAFWADHFTAHGKAGIMKRATSPYIDSAVRPHVAGRFADLLIAAVSHPVMLDYLDQRLSMGPGSDKAQRRGEKAGLNENLAREVLELHTLGASGPYGQDDVRELAKLFTGMTFNPRQGFRFRRDFAEPGAEVVLGRSYGPQPGMGPIRAALEDLAVHPATAAHVARKLAVHFVSDTPDAGLVQHLEATFARTGGDLMALYGALLEHPGAWDPGAPNIKWPAEFISSALRALAVPPGAVEALEEQAARQMFYAPLRIMGQHWQEPVGPDGWPEADSNWITPQSLSARIDWAVGVPQRLLGELPDPRGFAETALGSRASGAVRFAAGAAESKAEAIGIVLASPGFQRK